MDSITAKAGDGAQFALGAFTLGDGTKVQAIVLVDSAGTPIPAAANLTVPLQAIATALGNLPGKTDTLNVQGSVDVAGAVDVDNFPADYPDSATAGQVQALATAVQAVATAIGLQAKTSDTQPVAVVDDSFLMRFLLRPLSKLTFNLGGLRVDCGGSGVVASIAATQTLATVTTVANANNVCLGRLTADGQSVLQTRDSFQTGYRNRIT